MLNIASFSSQKELNKFARMNRLYQLNQAVTAANVFMYNGTMINPPKEVYEGRWNAMVKRVIKDLTDGHDLL